MEHLEGFSKVRVVIHAGGIGAIGAAMKCGKPMVIVPFVHEQPDNADRALQLGVAQVVAPGQYKSEYVSSVIRKVLVDDQMKRSARHLAKLVNREDGLATAARFIRSFDGA